jgi:hypothetical protein
MSKEKKFKFKRTKSETFTIVNDLKKEVGDVRVEPSRIGWKPAGETQWHYLTLKDFSNLAIHQGTKGDAG